MIKNKMLGDISIQHFLRHYWQKKPLLIRQAFPHFQSFVSIKSLCTLAKRDDVLSRVIKKENKSWQLWDGPFKTSEIKKLKGQWTLLVQGVNHFIPEAQNLLNHFNFIPHARLDDLMISYATDGAGVGPHFDSYDVFLLQGYGKRRWQISNQIDKSLQPNQPLKILKKFKPTEEWILEPGDMLYLPPQYAHNGIAIDECMTYSIGFRAPSHQELIMQYLGYLQSNLQIDGIYHDEGLTYSNEPGKISNQMMKQMSDVINNIKFDKNDIKKFLGMYLSETKPNLYIESPSNPISKKQFIQKANKSGIQLDFKICMLYTNQSVFINGECYKLLDPILKVLSNHRVLTEMDNCSIELMDLLYEWYLLGYVDFYRDRLPT